MLTRNLWDEQALTCASAMFFDQDKEEHVDSDPFRVLNDSRDFECLDPRDKVYGALGLFELIPYDLPPGLLPDYTLDLAEVFTRAMSWAISSDGYGHGLVDALNSISHRSQEDIHVEGLASWVPRWFRPWQSGLDASPIYTHDISKSRFRIRSHVVSDTSGYPEWHVRGVPLGEIGELIYSPASFDWLSFYEHYPVALRSLKGQELTDFTMFDLLTAGSRPMKVYSDQCESFVVWLDQFTHGISPGFEVTETSERWATTTQKACSRRSIGITDTGVPGLFPTVSRRGDHIVWLDRAEYPSVLRPRGDYFEFIGQVHISRPHKLTEEPSSEPKLYIMI